MIINVADLPWENHHCSNTFKHCTWATLLTKRLALTSLRVKGSSNLHIINNQQSEYLTNIILFRLFWQWLFDCAQKYWKYIKCKPKMSLHIITILHHKKPPKKRTWFIRRRSFDRILTCIRNVVQCLEPQSNRNTRNVFNQAKHDCVFSVTLLIYILCKKFYKC